MGVAAEPIDGGVLVDATEVGGATREFVGLPIGSADEFDRGSTAGADGGGEADVADVSAAVDAGSAVRAAVVAEPVSAGVGFVSEVFDSSEENESPYHPAAAISRTTAAPAIAPRGTPRAGAALVVLTPVGENPGIGIVEAALLETNGAGTSRSTGTEPLATGPRDAALTSANGLDLSLGTTCVALSGVTSARASRARFRCSPVRLPIGGVEGEAERGTAGDTENELAAESSALGGVTPEL